MQNTKEYFKKLINSLEIAEEIVETLPSDFEFKSTFETFLEAAKAGDKEAEELLFERLAGYLINFSNQNIY